MPLNKLKWALLPIRNQKASGLDKIHCQAPPRSIAFSQYMTQAGFLFAPAGIVQKPLKNKTRSIAFSSLSIKYFDPMVAESTYGVAMTIPAYDGRTMGNYLGYELNGTYLVVWRKSISSGVNISFYKYARSYYNNMAQCLLVFTWGNEKKEQPVESQFPGIARSIGQQVGTGLR